MVARKIVALLEWVQILHFPLIKNDFKIYNSI